MPSSMCKIPTIRCKIPAPLSRRDITDMRCYPKYTRKFCRVLYILFDIETGFYTEKIYIGKLRDIHTF
jgi:hypothetical protein